MSSKIIIAGGAGVLGMLLSDVYTEQGWEVVVLSRTGFRVSGNIRYTYWNGYTLGDWTRELEGATAVINLAGQSINTRFTAKKKQEILDSRVLTTTLIGDAIAGCKHPPAVWINAGGISIFEPSSTLFTEQDPPNGTGFLAQVSKQWEAAFADANVPATRKVQLRISSVLLSKGGMLDPLVKLVRLGLGGTVGPGNQYVSWIHERDFAKLVGWIITNDSVEGIVHACSPNPVTNKAFMEALRRRLRVSIGIPAPAWAVRLGARVIGTEPQLALDGHRVVSKILRDEDFRFDYPDVAHALDNLLL
ncbi:TIGR01777 family oxidoreductase [Parapedobacter sp. 2B3]|uniref:TIGR01777 family oxidoreductase n=1 Tax=Parapedobacter sp. 2B3 TaxID=3342381 RepID=UPI0035B68281